MPRSTTSTPPMMAATPPPRSRRRPRFISAVAAVATAALVLVSCPSSTHAAGGLRGESLQLPQHEVHDDRESKLRASLNDVEDEEASSRKERILAERGEVVTIDPFTIDLLATNFPYQMKYNKDNQLSSAVARYLATHLDETLDANVDNLGVTCKRSKKSVGQEVRWILKCEGQVTFDGDEMDGYVNSVVVNAFHGSNRNGILEVMYPNYEMLHEKKEYDTRFSALRAPRGRGKRGNKKQQGGKKGKKQKKNNGKKGKKKNKNKKPQMMMKPQSASAGGGGKNNNGLNVMGYVSGSQVMQQNSGGGNTDKNGNIVVYLSP